MKDTTLARKRLKIEYIELGSYDKLAERYGVNVRYVWDFVKNGNMPPMDVWKKIRCAWWVREAADNLVRLKEARNV